MFLITFIFSLTNFNLLMNQNIIDDYMLFEAIRNKNPMMMGLEVSTDVPYFFTLIQPENFDFQINADISSTIKSLNHPNLVSVKDIIIKGNIFYFINEFVKGETLIQKLIQKAQFLKVEKTMKYFKQIVNAIDYLHNNDFTLGCLTLDDVFIDENDNIKIINYSLFKFCEVNSINYFKIYPDVGIDIKAVRGFLKILNEHTIQQSDNFQSTVSLVFDMIEKGYEINELNEYLFSNDSNQRFNSKNINIFEVLSSSIIIDLRSLIDKKDVYERQFSFSLNKTKDEIIILIKDYIDDNEICETNQKNYFRLIIKIYNNSEKTNDFLYMNLHITEISRMKNILQFSCVKGQTKLFQSWVQKLKNELLV